MIDRRRGALDLRICKNREAARNIVRVPEKSARSSRVQRVEARPRYSSGSRSRAVTPSPRKPHNHCLYRLPGHSGPNPFSPLQSQSIPWLPCPGTDSPHCLGLLSTQDFQRYHQDSPRQTGQRVPPAPSSPDFGSLALSAFLTTHSTHPE